MYPTQSIAHARHGPAVPRPARPRVILPPIAANPGARKRVHAPHLVFDAAAAATRHLRKYLLP